MYSRVILQTLYSPFRKDQGALVVEHGSCEFGSGMTTCTRSINYSSLSLDTPSISSKAGFRTLLVAQCLRLRAPNAGGPGSIPSQGTRSHVPHLKTHLRATAKTQRSQLNEYSKVGGCSSVTIENCNILVKEKKQRSYFAGSRG